LKLRIATRRSKLALAQTRRVAEELRRLHPGLRIEEIQVVTQGDKLSDVSLAKWGGKGLFVTEVEAAVREGRADLAVHSLKDVPAELGEGLELVCVPSREDARDVLLTKEGCALEDLASGVKVGTSSLRRRIQLYRLRSDLDYAPLRGNVDTRIARLERGQYEAIVLAYAGLRRLDLAARPLHAFSIEAMIPAVGQGALALEARADDRRTRRIVSPLEDAEARAAVEAERAFLHALGGDCNVPLAGHARFDRPARRLGFEGMVGSADGGRYLRASAERYLTEPRSDLAAAARRMGQEVASMLLSQGASAIIEQARGLMQKRNDPRSRPGAG